MSIFVLICLELSSSLGEYPEDFGVLLNCTRNSCKAFSGGWLDFFKAFLKFSAAPFAAGWSGAPVK